MQKCSSATKSTKNIRNECSIRVKPSSSNFNCTNGVRSQDDNEAATVTTATVTTADGIVYETEIQLNTGTVLKMTIFENSHRQNSFRKIPTSSSTSSTSSSPTQTPSSSATNQIVTFQALKNRDSESKSAKKVRFGGEHIKLRTPEASDTSTLSSIDTIRSNESLQSNDKKSESSTSASLASSSSISSISSSSSSSSTSSLPPSQSSSSVSLSSNVDLPSFLVLAESMEIVAGEPHQSNSIRNSNTISGSGSGSGSVSPAFQITEISDSIAINTNSSLTKIIDTTTTVIEHSKLPKTVKSTIINKDCNSDKNTKKTKTKKSFSGKNFQIFPRSRIPVPIGMIQLRSVEQLNTIDESERVHTNPKTLIRRSATVPDVRTIRTVPLGNESTTKIDELVKKLKSSNWEQALKALKIIQEKMQTNFNEIYPFLCYISPALKTLMKNPRTSVVRFACDTVFVMFSQCPAHKLTTEVEELFPVLLTKVIDTNRFIRDIAEKALLSIPRCTTMFKLVRIVCNHGFKNVDKKSRAKISKMLFNFVQSSGSDTIFAHKREHVYELIRLISKFLTDNCPESRHYAKECLKLLAVDAKFIDYYFEKLASDLPLNVQKIFLDTIAND